MYASNWLKSRVAVSHPAPVHILTHQAISSDMDKALLSKTATAMVARGKGILAADESSGTCEKRFKSVNVESTE